MKKVALVTGASRGIGKVIVEDLSVDHSVALTWLNTDPANLPDTILSIKADLTEDGSAERIIEQVIDRFGRLDLIVNNAGAVASSPLDALDQEALARMLHVNVLAANALLVAALPHLQLGAAIVNISSVNAVLPPRGAALFGASKAALNLWTKGMAKELGPKGIRVNAIAPGAVDLPDEPRSDELKKLFVDETALGRIATPQDVANGVRFLAGESASFITGEILTISGGYRL